MTPLEIASVNPDPAPPRSDAGANLERERTAAPRQLLLASAGRAVSDDATRTAAALARRLGLSVRVVSVFTPPVAYPREDSERRPPAVLPSDRTAADAQLAAVRDRLAEVARAASWPVELAVGDVGLRVAEAARAARADLVVIGAGRARATERALGDRAAVGIAANLTAPLLAVAPGFAGTPRTVLVAVGLDAATVRAAALAVALFPAPELVILAHVRPGPSLAAGATDDPNEVAAQIAAVRRTIAPWRAIRTELVILTGDTVQRLMTLARSREADLIVGGLHGATYDERAHIRNAALRLLAESGCSVLLLPAAVAPIADARERPHSR